MQNFHKYFAKQWVDKFSKWQLFNTPPGHAHTNNPVEQYNNTIKTDFTDRLKYHMKPALQVFTRLIQYESKKTRLVMEEGKVTTIIRKFQNTGKEEVGSYTQVRLQLHSSYWCTCSIFCLYKVVCTHLFAACIKDGVELFGLRKRPKRYAAVRRKQTKNKLDDSDAEDVQPPQSSSDEDQERQKKLYF
jgi:hypothetical protein